MKFIIKGSNNLRKESRPFAIVYDESGRVKQRLGKPLVPERSSTWTPVIQRVSRIFQLGGKPVVDIVDVSQDIADDEATR